MKDVVLSHELGCACDPETALRDVSAALAAGDRSAAHFIASLPKESWGFPAAPERRAISWVARAVFALLRGEAAELEVGVDFLHGLVFDLPLPAPLAPRLAELQNLQRVLEALARGAAAPATALLEERQELRARLLRELPGHAPFEVVDLPGLALCRLAQARNLPVRPRSPYLPLRLLEVPPTG